MTTEQRKHNRKHNRKVIYLKELKVLKEKKMISYYKYKKEIKWIREF